MFMNERTCTEAGTEAYWSCGRCGKYFSDEAGATEIEDGSWVIDATGHAWGTPAYEWAADHAGDVIPVPGEVLQLDRREVGRSHEDDAHYFT